MVHEILNNVQNNIETLLTINEVQFKSVRVAHYREASYFAFKGSYVYVIADIPFSGDPKICFVGSTTNLSQSLRTHARNHRFSHAFVVDLGEMGKPVREFAKTLLAEKFDPNFQGHYNSFEIYRSNNFERELTTRDVEKWKEMRTVKAR